MSQIAPGTIFHLVEIPTVLTVMENGNTNELFI